MPDLTYGRTLRERLFSRLVIDPSGCLLWTGSLRGGGYGRINIAGRAEFVHRVMWEMFESPIPEGLQIDHLCRVRRCANVAHLEPVTPRINTLRGNTLQAMFAAQTHCINNHLFDDANTYWTPGKPWRVCRACRLAATRRYQAKAKERRRTARAQAEQVRALANGQVSGE